MRTTPGEYRKRFQSLYVARFDGFPDKI
jgi:hypothetical protein